MIVGLYTPKEFEMDSIEIGTQMTRIFMIKYDLLLERSYFIIKIRVICVPISISDSIFYLGLNNPIVIMNKASSQKSRRDGIIMSSLQDFGISYNNLCYNNSIPSGFWMLLLYDRYQSALERRKGGEEGRNLLFKYGRHGIKLVNISIILCCHCSIIIPIFPNPNFFAIISYSLFHKFSFITICPPS